MQRSNSGAFPKLLVHQPDSMTHVRLTTILDQSLNSSDGRILAGTDARLTRQGSHRTLLTLWLTLNIIIRGNARTWPRGPDASSLPDRPGCPTLLPLLLPDLHSSCIYIQDHPRIAASIPTFFHILREVNKAWKLPSLSLSTSS